MRIHDHEAAGQGAASGRRAQQAFSLLEVMIALAIFFMAVFSILDLMSRNIKMARALQRTSADPAMVLSELSLTNMLEEGTFSGDFGDIYPNATWEESVVLVSTNGLFQVDVIVSEKNDYGVVSTNGITALLYRPQSVMGAGAGRIR